MNADTVVQERIGGVAVLTLSRPGAKNAIDAAMADSLSGLLHELRADDSVRALVLAGAGGNFCAGGDIKGMNNEAQRTVEERRAGMVRYRDLVERFATFNKPLVCAVDGVAFGAGLSMALWADIVLVSPRVRLAMAFHRIGLVPDLGAWYTLPRVVGFSRARELIYSAREFGAEEAVHMGLALESLPTEALIPRAIALAQAFEGVSPTAFSLSKAALAATLQSDLSTMLEMEACAQAIAGSSTYFREAVRRFVAREPATFQWPAKQEST